MQAETQENTSPLLLKVIGVEFRFRGSWRNVEQTKEHQNVSMLGTGESRCYTETIKKGAYLPLH